MNSKLPREARINVVLDASVMDSLSTPPRVYLITKGGTEVVSNVGVKVVIVSAA